MDFFLHALGFAVVDYIGVIFVLFIISLGIIIKISKGD